MTTFISCCITSTVPSLSTVNTIEYLDVNNHIYLLTTLCSSPPRPSPSRIPPHYTLCSSPPRPSPSRIPPHYPVFQPTQTIPIKNTSSLPCVPAHPDHPHQEYLLTTLCSSPPRPSPSRIPPHYPVFQPTQTIPIKNTSSLPCVPAHPDHPHQKYPDHLPSVPHLIKTGLNSLSNASICWRLELKLGSFSFNCRADDIQLEGSCSPVPSLKYQLERSSSDNFGS